MDIDEAVRDHQGGLVATAIGLVLLVLQWLLKREIKRRDDTVDDHEERLRDIEADRATKSDISGLYDALNKMRDRAEERHLELLDRMP